MARTSPVALVLFVVALPSLASARRVQRAALHEPQRVLAAPAPAGGAVSKALLKADEDECKAAMLKCAGVNGGEVEPEEATENGPATPAAFVQEEAAVNETLASSASEGQAAAGATEERLLSVELAAMDFHDFRCQFSEWVAFQKKFGLSGGGRFPHANFDNGGVCKENNVVWLYPWHDHNGAFSINMNVCHRLLMWSQNACSVSVRRVSSIADAEAYLSRFPANSIVHLVLGGHGNGYALEWGDKPEGWFGIVQQRGGVPVGSIVEVVRPFRRRNQGSEIHVLPGERGYVGNVAPQSGSGMVYFDKSGFSFVGSQEFGTTVRKVSQLPSPTTLMARISSKMQPHGSIFTDSCKSASGKFKPNLAAWVSQTVGKGVRVIGSEVSFGKVDVKRFQGGWHASLNVEELQHAQRVFVNEEARCPLWAKWSRPDANGNCACRMLTTCRTQSGKLCPAAHGKESGDYFLPFCGETWAQDPCSCTSGAGATAPSLLLVLLSLGSLFTGLLRF